MQRVMWLSSLSPTEYLTLLAVGDLMLDPYPFGGGVTILESIAVCTPVITSPSLQTVPGLAAGMLQSMNITKLDLLIATNPDDYVEKATMLLGAKDQVVDKELNRLRRKMCEKGHLLFNNTKSVDEWGHFLKNVALRQ
jgi:predicted O-linked N-acetylglucosamine transferase (SPINDLY family)